MRLRTPATTTPRTLADFPEHAQATESLRQLVKERDALQQRIDDFDFASLNAAPKNTARFDPLAEAQKLVAAGTFIAPEPKRPAQSMPSLSDLQRDLAVLNRRVKLQEAIVTAVKDRCSRIIADETGPAVTATHPRIIAAVRELAEALEAQEQALNALRQADIPVTILESRGVPLLAPPASKRSDWTGKDNRAARWLEARSGKLVAA